MGREAKPNAVKDMSYQFAIRTVRLYQHLSSEKKEFVLSKQLLRSGTSVGANVHEAPGGVSKKDFANKMAIAYKEALENKYWLSLLHDTDYLNDIQYKSIYADADSLCSILYSIINTTRNNT